MSHMIIVPSFDPDAIYRLQWLTCKSMIMSSCPCKDACSIKLSLFQILIKLKNNEIKIIKKVLLKIYLPIVTTSYDKSIETVKLAVVNWCATSICEDSMTKHGLHPLKLLRLIAVYDTLCIFVFWFLILILKKLWQFTTIFEIRNVSRTRWIFTKIS